MLIRWHRRRVAAVCIVAVFLYFMLRSQEQQAIFKAIIRDKKPVEIWEFVADFSNMKKLNPTILDFNILAESGNYDHWKYSAEYTEFLPQFSFIQHSTHAHFEVKPDGDSYVINSNHSTCFFKDMVCFPSTSQYRFSELGSSTMCVEQVTYQCPVLFKLMCEKDVKYQRGSVLKNLEKHFSEKKKQKIKR